MKKNIVIAALVATGFCGYQWNRTATQYEEYRNQVETDLIPELNAWIESCGETRKMVWVYDKLIHTGANGAGLPTEADSIQSWKDFCLFIDEHPKIDLLELCLSYDR